MRATKELLGVLIDLGSDARHDVAKVSGKKSVLEVAFEHFWAGHGSLADGFHGRDLSTERTREHSTTAQCSAQVARVKRRGDCLGEERLLLGIDAPCYNGGVNEASQRRRETSWLVAQGLSAPRQADDSTSRSEAQSLGAAFFFYNRVPAMLY